ncbi:MAG TPA: protein-methionine-sulfoxide reductase catalytic subunit MsrP [Usitatibacter sp.]|nr:protein-methionine-sulfoxide reductase catalytic subunit MsrP [Usitatibacter sp.]
MYDRDIRPSEITPESIAFGRRRLLGAAAGLAFTWGSGAAWASAPNARELFRSPPRSRYSTDEALTPIEIATTRTRFRELEEDIAKNGEAYTPYPWKVSVEGACAKPRVFDLDDLLRLAPFEERIYRMLCTEGWLHIVPYIGYPLSEVLKRVEPTANAKYVEFTSLFDPKQFRGQREITYIDWPYVEGLRIDEAMHPLTFVALGAYGQILPKGLGAPIAVRVPWKFGTKSPKAVVRMRLMEDQPRTIWPARYPKLHTFWGNVNPQGKSALFGRGMRERAYGDIFSSPTRQYNGYAEHVASLYTGMDLERMY